MKTATKTTVAQLMTGRSELTLVRWDVEHGGHLSLVRHADGRIDMVDQGCNDTGTDCSDRTTDQLMAEVRNWLNCIEADDEDTRDAIEQAEAAIA